MKRNSFNQKDGFLFIEFATVVTFLLLPPLFSAEPFTLPPKPAGLYAQGVFYFCTMCAAAYEELLYRLYTPNRLHYIYSSYIEPQLRKKIPATEYSARLPILPFSPLRCENYPASIFTLCLTELPALLLFTLAHRYLGVASMLFAAGAGVLFRIAYLRCRRVFHPAVSIAVVAAVHGLWNIGVYYYLWAHTVTL